MENSNDVRKLSKVKRFSLDAQTYINNKFKEMELQGKGFGVFTNVHIYADKNSLKCEENLIAYIIFHPAESEIEIKECNVTQYIKHAGLFKNLNIPEGSRYNLNISKDIDDFDDVVNRINSLKFIN